MIVDFHTHLAFHEIYPAAFIEAMLEGEGSPETVKQLTTLARRWLGDVHGERLIKEMDDAGIARSVLLIIDAGIRFGEAAIGIEQSYELHNRVRERHPDRFLVFGGVDPRRGRSGLELFRRSVIDWGFDGMKLYPPMGFSLDDSRFEPYLDLCAEHGLPVLTHTGPSSEGLDHEFGDPHYVGALARRRPELMFVMAHVGHRIGDPEVKRAMTSENVMLDLSAFQANARAFGWEQTSKDLRWIFDLDFNERVVFGSDYPLFHLSVGIKDDVARIRSVFDGLKLDDVRRLENVLWRNADRLLMKQRSNVGRFSSSGSPSPLR